MTGYKLVGLGACTEWIRAGTYYHWVIAQQGQLGRCPRLAGIPPPEGPMMPPPYPPVMAAAPPVMAATSTQATIPNPPQGRGQTTPSRVPTMKKGRRCCRCPRHHPGYRGVPETPPARVAEQHLESPALHGAPQGNVVVPSLGGGIPARRFRSPSRNTKADFRPFGRCMKRPENTGWPLR